MIGTPHPCFGYVVFITSISPEDILEYEIKDPGGFYDNGYYYNISGTVKAVVKETGEVLIPRVPGWMNSEHKEGRIESTGTLQITSPDNAVWVCFSKKLNQSRVLPTNLSSITTKTGDILEFNEVSNLFLAKGCVLINSRKFTGPTQLHIRNLPASILCETDCYIMRVPIK